MANQIPRKRLRFHCSQRLFWICLYRLWPGCRQTLQVFKPDTKVRWHRKGFKLDAGTEGFRQTFTVKNIYNVNLD